MKTYKEFTSEMTPSGRIALVASMCLIIIAIIGLIIFFAFRSNVWPATYFTKDTQKEIVVGKDDATSDLVDSATDTLLDREAGETLGETTGGTSTSGSGAVQTNTANQYSLPNVMASDYIATTQEVKIALVIEQNEYQIDNVLTTSCGELYLVTARVKKPMVLNNSIDALFGDRVIADFLPGNIIPSYHPNLTFTSATLVNGEAKIYLGGSFTAGGCGTALAISQLQETALAFPTVDSVNIYLGSNKVN